MFNKSHFPCLTWSNFICLHVFFPILCLHRVMIIKSKRLNWLLLSGLVSAEVDHEEYGGVHHKQAAEHKA